MASNMVYLENPRTGQMKEAPIGFSWTTLFFGPLPMLFRGAWKWFAIILILALITWGLSNLVFIFLINKLYLKDLVADGFRVKSAKMGTVEQVSMTVGFPLPAAE